MALESRNEREPLSRSWVGYAIYGASIAAILLTEFFAPEDLMIELAWGSPGSPKTREYLFTWAFWLIALSFLLWVIAFSLNIKAIWKGAIRSGVWGTIVGAVLATALLGIWGFLFAIGPFALVVFGVFAAAGVTISLWAISIRP